MLVRNDPRHPNRCCLQTRGLVGIVIKGVWFDRRRQFGGQPNAWVINGNLIDVQSFESRERNLTMAKNEMKRQKKLMKKRQKDKVRRKHQVEAIGYTNLSVKAKIRMARQYPIYECRINPNWQKSGLATVTVARHQPDGDILFGVYLVDILCLGLKNTLYGADFSAFRYRKEIVEGSYRHEGSVVCSMELAHQIVYGGIAYARQFGFEPQKDFQLSHLILEPLENVSLTEDIEFGRDGKPLYVQGPHDNVQRIIKQLEKTAGSGHYDYVVQS